MRASVVIPNGNGRHHLETCLAALAVQTERDFEIICVDNESTDDSVAFVESTHPSVRILRLAWNGVFAGAVNAGIRATRGDTIVLLNNDTEAEPRWLEELLAALDAAPDASVAASKMLLWDRRDTLHSAGDYYRLDGIPGSRGVWERDDGRYDADHYIFGACAGAAAYRRGFFDDIGLFDQSLVAYCEDVDLNIRALLRGHRCVFAPAARVYHRLSATGGGAFASYYCARNFVTIAARDLPAPIARRHWRSIVGRQVALALEAAPKALREPAALARLRGQFDGIRGLPHALAGRAAMHGRAKADWRVIESLMRRGPRPVGDA
ncbi:MAG: glycosyltransferase family 2 protein [Chloroflexota bacterium]|nr:MAG: glycosyltransferase family 2 protein [Chloroflexota bacterium]